MRYRFFRRFLWANTPAVSIKRRRDPAKRAEIIGGAEQGRP